MTLMRPLPSEGIPRAIEPIGSHTCPADVLLAGICGLHSGSLEEELDETLRRVARLAVATLPGCDFADVTLTHHGEPLVTGSSTSSGVAGEARSRLAMPLKVDGTLIGTLTLYAEREGSLLADDIANRLFAEQAAVTLANATTHATIVTMARQLQQAFESRGPIEQAKGILIARHRCTPNDAFAMLVERSQHENRKLRLVADDIVRDAQCV